MNLSRKANYLGKFVEVRNGIIVDGVLTDNVKCLVHKYEEVIPVEVHNAKIDAQVANIVATKVDESVKVGKVESLAK